MKVTSQQILDAGLNVFGLHLFLESVARFKPNPEGNEPLEFEFDHRGINAKVRLHLTALHDEQAQGEQMTTLRLIYKTRDDETSAVDSES
jgi:hypothetical protein